MHDCVMFLTSKVLAHADGSNPCCQTQTKDSVSLPGGDWVTKELKSSRVAGSTLEGDCYESENSRGSRMKLKQMDAGGSSSSSCFCLLSLETRCLASLMMCVCWFLFQSSTTKDELCIPAMQGILGLGLRLETPFQDSLSTFFHHHSQFVDGDHASSWGVMILSRLGALCLLLLVLVLLRSLILVSRNRIRMQRLLNLLPKHCLAHEVPQGHWFLGHLSILGQSDYASAMYELTVRHASPHEGTSVFWVVDQPVISFLKAEDALQILKHEHHRSMPPLTQKHWFKFLGDHSLGECFMLCQHASFLGCYSFSSNTYNESFVFLIVMATGEAWGKGRQLVHRALVSSALQTYQPGIIRTAQRSVQAVLKTIASQQQVEGTSQTHDHQEKELLIPSQFLFKNVALDTFGITALGYDFQSALNLDQPHPLLEQIDFLQTELLRRAFAQPLNLAAQCYWWPCPMNQRYRREHSDLRSFVKSIIINNRRAQGLDDTKPKENLLGWILLSAGASAGSASSDGAEGVDDDHLADFLITLLYGGFDTSSITLSYLMYIMATRHDLEALCVQEIETVLGSKDEQNEDGTIADTCDKLTEESLPFCTAVLLETLRFYPPVASTARDLLQPRTIAGKTYPEGCRLFVCPWTLHRDERNFARPLEFLPERWAQRKAPPQESDVWVGNSDWVLRSYKDEQEAAHKDTAAAAGSAGGDHGIPAANREYMFAFSSGARRCVAYKFAMQELLTIFAVFLRELKFSPVGEYGKPKQVRVGPVHYPSEGLPIRIRKRYI
jgi:cytochrome P450